MLEPQHEAAKRHENEFEKCRVENIRAFPIMLSEYSMPGSTSASLQIKITIFNTTQNKS